MNQAKSKRKKEIISLKNFTVKNRLISFKSKARNVFHGKKGNKQLQLPRARSLSWEVSDHLPRIILNRMQISL